ncbi:MAG: PhzF family phenazine biosynthesis protein [Actinomycetes bacterium]
MIDRPEVLRYAAFTRDPAAGNPAGVVLDAGALDDAEMLAVAAEVGYSETAFLSADPAHEGRWSIRYFSPLAEVPFCGHATIASGVALAERAGPGQVALDTQGGLVVVDTRYDEDGALEATLTSVDPRVAPVDAADLEEALAALRWERSELDPGLPPGLAYAGAWHLVLAAATRERLAHLDYDFTRLGDLMAARSWTTVHLVWREDASTFHVRDPFPPGGVVEDPATGAAAAAFGAYLRSLGEVRAPARVTLRQGEDLGRPSRLTVEVPESAGPLRVSGNAVVIPAQFIAGSSG